MCWSLLCDVNFAAMYEYNLITHQQRAQASQHITFQPRLSTMMLGACIQIPALTIA